MTDTFDVVVLGGGSTGTNVAWYARDNGLSVAVVERELVGGECSYWACIPSKALLGPPAVLAAARRMPGVSSAVTGELDVDAVLARRDDFIAHLDDDGQARWVQGIGAELVRGDGRLVGPRQVEVRGPDGSVRRLAATAVVVATGSRPAMPPVKGLDAVRPWDNREVTTAKQVPRRLVVLGGGVVGCEMAQAYRRLGAEQVTVVQRGNRLLPMYDPWVGELLEAVFADEGIAVLTGRTATSASREGEDGPVALTLENGSTVTGDELLVATGRRFNTEEIGLEQVGLEPGRGPLEVDDQLRVKGIDGGWLYAAGDVNGRALLTHQGKYQGRQLGDILAGRRRETYADERAVPQVVFTDPEVASVGRTEQEARSLGMDVQVVRYDPGSVAGGRLLWGDVRSGGQLVVDAQRRVVVGATFVGPGVGEMLHAATIAIVGEVPIDTLWHAVPAFPTVSEVWLRLLEAYRGVI